ncbi:MAG: DEAD/DEAH box helicase family protein [Phycisphaerales bacterium]|nr:DEAD/DEAH box helicase family protein [Phycisphaerales bacterium]
MSARETKRLKQPDSLIINSPYREPERYWKYDREHKQFVQIEGERRPAGYMVATEDSKAHDDPGLFKDLPLVNMIRTRVKDWRAKEWPGVTGTTRRLLQHWYDNDARKYPFFFCQLEAIETLIWLTEASPADHAGVHVPGDGGPFTRYCTKLATGGGKTLVMAMTIAWQFLNKLADPQDRRFSKTALIVAPGLTVRSRLSVLNPSQQKDKARGEEQNYYEAFGIVPDALMSRLRQGQVLILNWHKLDWETEEQIAKKKGVDKRGAKSDEAYVRGVLGDMANARNILVLNDEAHHAWRVPEGKGVPGVSKSDREEATKWVGGLDRIHRARGIQACFDYSATPFTPTGKKSSDEQLFPWIVSDFGLNDAIESGMVKTPRVVIRDDAQVDSKTFKSKLYHIFRDKDVADDLNSPADPEVPLPDLVTQAYYLLGLDWRETARDWAEKGHQVPPVMITVANRTETAARIKYAFDHRQILIEELCAPDKTLHIDSKVLDQAEAQDEPVVVDAGSAGDDEDSDDDAPIVKLTKKQLAEQLRREVDTVGRAGEPGAHIQNVISVGMLSEGWDAKTVTHIMGLRAFSSQLLCEQVVGRGLRRTSYDMVEGQDRFTPEYVNIFGIPFSFMPHEREDGPPPPPPAPKTEIKALPERAADFEINWPNILKIERVYAPELDVDLSKVPVLTLKASDTRQLAELAPTVDGKQDFSRIARIELEKLAKEFRFQRLAFEGARDAAAQMKGEWRGSQSSLVTQLIDLYEKFLQSDRLQIEPALFEQDELRRRLMMALNRTQVSEHLYQVIKEQNVLEQEDEPRLRPVFNEEQPVRCTGDMPAWYTSKPCELTRRSHINFCVYDSTWEAYHASRLDSDDYDGIVQAWAKNDHLGFEVWYQFRGARKRFRPDFLVRLVDGTMLVLETKGQDNDENRAKRRALNEWIEAVNEHGGFGRWTCDVALTLDEIDSVLHRTGNVLLSP